MHRGSRVSVIVLCVVPILRGQATGASLTGRITDPSGAAIGGANVLAINAATKISGTSLTNSFGAYYFANVSPGSYRLEIQKAGFKTLMVPDVILHLQDTLEIDLALTVGSTSESVTVEGGTQLTESGAVSTVVDHQFVANLPLNGRSFQNLFQLTPGVLVATTSYYDQGQFNVNGQRGDANYFAVDGVSANFGVAAGPLGQSGGGGLPALSAGGGFNSLASVDAVQEFRIQTSTFAPEFGRMPGAQIDISTRSGSNDFHGTLFDYLRNDKLDANNWFANQQSKPKPKERQNDFGGVLGGPVVKNKTFFFISYEGLRLRQPQVVVAGVPDLALRNGAPAPLRSVLEAYPAPNGPELGGGLAQFSAGNSAPSNLDAGSVRIDHTTGKLSLFGRFDDAPSSALAYAGSPMAPNVMQDVGFNVLTATLGATWLIRPSLSNDFRFNFSRSSGSGSLELTNVGGAVPLDPSLVLPQFSGAQDGLFAFFCCSLNSELAFGRNARNSERQLNEVENLTYVKGAHQLKFGIDARDLSPTYGRRAYDTQYLYPTTASVLGNSPAEVVVDAAGGAAGLRVVAHNVSMFAQDIWRASRRLTLDYGLRWEYNPAPSVANRQAPWVVDQIIDLATTKLVSSGAPLWNASKTNFAPRVGFAYQLSDSSQWGSAIRGGGGVFYDTGFGQLGDVFADNAQYYGQTIYTTNVAFPLTSAQQQPPPLATAALPISQAAVFDPHLKLPYTVQWNVTLEQRLGIDQTLDVMYVGAAGRRLLLQTYYSRPDPSFNSLFVTDNGATSDYDALQAQFRRRLSHGLQALASYRWSHSIDTASSDSFILSDSPGRASSNFDIRHAATGALTYDIPAAAGAGWAPKLLRDWSVDDIFIARTAEPITIVSATAFIAGTYTGVLPNLQPGVPIDLADPHVAGGRRINPAAFAAPPAGQMGGAPRNLLRGFGAWQSDFALRREFSLPERFRLQLRAEFFNIFNHPNFANPTNNLSSPLFGISTMILAQGLGSGGTTGGFAPLYQMGGPRSVQLALKLQF